MQASQDTQEALANAKRYLIEALRLAERDGIKATKLRKLETITAKTEALQADLQRGK